MQLDKLIDFLKVLKEFYNIKYISKSFQGTQMLLRFYIESKLGF